MKHYDQMDSFVLAETFKYLYLLFTEPSDLPINLDNFVLSTEAHLLPIGLGVSTNWHSQPSKTSAHSTVSSSTSSYSLMSHHDNAQSGQNLLGQNDPGSLHDSIPPCSSGHKFASASILPFYQSDVHGDRDLVEETRLHHQARCSNLLHTLFDTGSNSFASKEPVSDLLPGEKCSGSSTHDLPPERLTSNSDSDKSSHVLISFTGQKSTASTLLSHIPEQSIANDSIRSNELHERSGVISQKQVEFGCRVHDGPGHHRGRAWIQSLIKSSLCSARGCRARFRPIVQNGSEMLSELTLKSLNIYC
ncbi:unnamed protein product [Protopolystoma xenopodis]|uniref:Alpha-1,2-Mannosidase n=1 Tax=Protopolystoma xenopodis TaxID=117903 RepID=A0A3S5CF60_9PLAT|nr:unnamed protein product [Protopolystoma xenopodis]